MPDDALMHAVLTALRSCYGSLENPDYRRVAQSLSQGPNPGIVSALKAIGVEVNDTTDANDDVSSQLYLSRAGEHATVELSAVGPFAVLRQSGPDGPATWVAGVSSAKTPLTAAVAPIIEQAGFRLLRRDFVTNSIQMQRDGDVVPTTLYQALFTDSDRIP